MTRVAAIWWPEWPVVAAGCASSVPAAVLAANRVVAVSAVAHADGVELGQRRRAAQAACPALEVFAPDPAREALTFEPVLTAVDAFTPIVELTRPGACTFSTRGPARYFGGDDTLAARVHAALLCAASALHFAAPANAALQAIASRLARENTAPGSMSAAAVEAEIAG